MAREASAGAGPIQVAPRAAPPAAAKAAPKGAALARKGAAKGAPKKSSKPILKYAAIFAGILVIGLSGGLGATLVVSRLWPAATPAPETPAAVEGQETGVLFYKVQTWFEFATPAGRDALGEPLIDPASGLSILPPRDLRPVPPQEYATRAAGRSQSAQRLGEAGFDAASIVWMLESGDGKTSMLVRSKQGEKVIEPKDYEEVFGRYEQVIRDLLPRFGIADVEVEAAFFQGGLGIYAKFVDPGPPQSVIHTVQVLGSPDGRVLTLTFSRPAEIAATDWEAAVQASIESLGISGRPLQ